MSCVPAALLAAHQPRPQSRAAAGPLRRLERPEQQQAQAEKAREQKKPSAAKLPTIFWGIIDLKYDAALPVFERVKVLETGDGRTSRFSGAGADILKLYQERYCFEEGVATAKHAVISANKKLTHDLLDFVGYTHILPRQVCFPRLYEPDLALRIAEGLEVGPEGAVVLKLCNRTRAAGVLPVRVQDLDDTLQRLLVLPEDLEGWLAERLKARSLAFLQVVYGSFEEQVRHWWSNECPFFVAERLCVSMTTTWEGQEYDGTLRVAFALRRREVPATPGQPPAEETVVAGDGGPARLPPAEELVIDWLGGYWKLPKEHVESDKFRERIISAARTSGTVNVEPRHLAEIYAALGDSVQRIFGGSEPTAATLAQWYENSPTVASYLIARLAVAFRSQAKGRAALDQAKTALREEKDGPAKLCAESFIARGLGVFALQVPYSACWPQAQVHLQRSLKHHPFNASSMYLLGMIKMEDWEPDLEQAVLLMARSIVLDPDFRGPYVNLGAAFLRLGSSEAAIKVSEVGLSRHPQSPQCHYHIALGCYMISVFLEKQKPVEKVKQWHVDLRKRALESLMEARKSEEAQRILSKGRDEVPWSSTDEELVQELTNTKSFFLQPRRVAPVNLGARMGWRWMQWRT